MLIIFILSIGCYFRYRNSSYLQTQSSLIKWQSYLWRLTISIDPDYLCLKPNWFLFSVLLSFTPHSSTDPYVGMYVCRVVLRIQLATVTRTNKGAILKFIGATVPFYSWSKRVQSFSTSSLAPEIWSFLSKNYVQTCYKLEQRLDVLYVPITIFFDDPGNK